MIENVEIICKLLHILLEDYFAARKLDDLVHRLRMMQRTVQSHCNKSEEGIVLILAALDRKLKNIFGQVAVFPENLEYICKGLNFDKILSDLEDGTFHFTDIPWCIKNISIPSNAKDRRNKRRRPDDDEESIGQHLSESRYL